MTGRANSPHHPYPLVGEAGKWLPPQYERVVRALTDADLDAELAGDRGDREYRAALLAEREARRISKRKDTHGH